MSNKKHRIYLSVQMALLSLALPSIVYAEPDSSLEQWRTKEYKRQPGLDMINAAKAYSLGFTGKGVTVGYLDSGIQATQSLRVPLQAVLTSTRTPSTPTAKAKTQRFLGATAATSPALLGHAAMARACTALPSTVSFLPLLTA